MSHNIENLRAELRQLVDSLIYNTQFDLYLSGAQSFYDWKYQALKSWPEEINCSNGATRFVFWDNRQSGIVFKMAIDRDDDIDYNANEVFIYQKAEENDVAHWFAWTEKIDSIDIDGVVTDFYAMDYCDAEETLISDSVYNLYVREFCDDEGWDVDNLNDTQREYLQSWIDSEAIGDSEGMEHYMYQTYDWSDVTELYTFLNKYHINDTHSGNWGYKDDYLVLIDYAGYNRNLIQMAPQCV